MASPWVQYNLVPVNGQHVQQAGKAWRCTGLGGLCTFGLKAQGRRISTLLGYSTLYLCITTCVYLAGDWLLTTGWHWNVPYVEKAISYSKRKWMFWFSLYISWCKIDFICNYWFSDCIVHYWTYCTIVMDAFIVILTVIFSSVSTTLFL